MEDNEKIDYIRVNEILERYGVETVIDMALILESKGAKSLQHNIKAEVLEDLEFIKLTISMPSYGVFADQGRKAGKFPPKDKIQMWCISRNISIKYSYQIGRKISKLGTQGKEFIKVFYDKFPMYRSELQQALKSDYAMHLKKMLIK